MGFFEKHKKTGYGVFYNIDNSGTKKPTHHPLFRLLPCGEDGNCRLRRKVSFFQHLI